MKFTILHCWLVFVLVADVDAASFLCNVTTNTDPSTWPKLPTIPDAFKTNVEINLVDQQSTMDAVLYFDNFGNRAALYTVKEGLNGVSVYDFPSNEVFYVTNGVCLVANITERAEADLFGITDTDGNYHVMQSSTVLKFGEKYNETYVGTDIVRGINVDHWRSCLHWNRSNANFTVDYYFSKRNDWMTSSAFLTVPVRANVTGVYIHKDGSTKPINHVYEFNAFTGSLDINEKATVFETPKGVICKGRKKSKPVPDLPRQFYYRQEIALDDIITYYDVWYFEKYHYLRYDYRPIRPSSPFFSTNPVTEILDYNTGVHYYKDNGYGNCTILPLEKTSFGAKLMINSKKTNQTGYFKLDIENPMDLFYLDKNFTFVGTRPCREMLCDVYSAIRKNLVIGGNVDPADTVIEMYILSTDSYLIYPEHGQGKPPNVVPVMMTLLADKVGFSETIHFYDFDSDPPDFSVFDVSSCYNDMSQVQFSVKFPGRFVGDRVNTMKQMAQVKFAEIMGIEITRLQHFRVDIDYADVYIHATLLDRLPAAPQFSYMGTIEIVDMGDMDIGKVNTPMQCAEMCIGVSNFTCNSFDFCPQDPQRTCRLNQQHISDGLRTKNRSTCGHYSRTADGPRHRDKSILDAYQALRLAVYKKQLTLEIEMDNQEMVYYLAVDTSIEFGAAKPTELPLISAQFTYGQEVVIPSTAQVFESKVWYNSKYKLVRYDYHDNKPTAPYFTVNPMTMIHDFNTGLQYVVDKFFNNCTISPISPGQFDAELDQTDYLKDHSFIVQMKNPLELFHTNNQIKYAGQKTIRNILCDVFIGLDENYYVPGLNGSHPAILEFYFLTEGWSDIGKDDDSQNTFTPVKMDITIPQKGLFFTYNFFNFEVDEPNTFNAYDLFNIQKCYSDRQQHRFQIKFPGPFHPFLDIYQRMFLIETVACVGEAAGVYPLRVQGARVDHDEDNIYFTATLMDRAPYLAQFTKEAGMVMAHKTAGFYLGVSTPEECASACVQTKSFPCNSFDICPSVKYCFVSSNHTSHGPTLSNGTICDHYSRTVNALPQPTLDLYNAYINLKNDVYSNLIQISIPGPNNTLKIYTASSIRDTILQQTSIPQGGRQLRSFSLYKNNVIYQHNDETLEGVAVDDCAIACLMEELFDCQSFEYCPVTEMCYLSKVQPDLNTTEVVPSDSCNLYSRLYLDRYEKSPGVVYSTPGYKEVHDISTDNMCAKQCSSDPLCKSFDYCANTDLCTLRRTHKLDMSNDTIISRATCSHYSRKYISDFVVKYGRNMMIDSIHEVTGVTADQCAKLCIDQEASQCSSFIFCGNQTICQLKTELPSQAPIVASQYCNLYTRPFTSPSGCNGSSLPHSHPFTIPGSLQTTMTSPQPTPAVIPPSRSQSRASKTLPPNPSVIPPSSSQSRATKTLQPTPPVIHPSRNPSKMTQNNTFCTPQTVVETKNNPGVLVGVAFGLFIIGLIFGGVISFFLFKKYNLRSDDMNMQLINN